jgi:hypothetical protein
MKEEESIEDDMKQSLIAFDTDRIKEFVFATDVLKEIRGASNILDTLNRQDMPHCVGGICYYAHGGSGLFVVPTDDATACINRVRHVYAEQTGGAATITGVELQLPDSFDVEHDNIQALWKHLGYKLRAAKARNPVVRTSVTHPLLHFGHADGEFYATHIDEEDELISTVSVLKRARNHAIRQEAIRQGQDLPEDFAAIAAASSPSNYFALIYADGDSLGQALEACPTLSDIHSIATGIDEILAQIKDAAIARQELSSCQYDTLLHGGDDLILAAPAHAALAIALDVSEEFRRRTQQRFGKAYTLSMAIVWAHATFPFGTWFEMAESALKFAKYEGAKRKTKGLINFLVISSTNHLDFKRFYNQVLSAEEGKQWKVVRTLRPYTTEDLRRLVHYRQTLKRLPRGKLEALRQAVFQPRTRAIFEALRVLVHWRNEAVRMTMQEMVHTLVNNTTEQTGSLLFPFVEVKDAVGDTVPPLTTYRTPIADLAELWDFIPGGADEE